MLFPDEHIFQNLSHSYPLFRTTFRTRSFLHHSQLIWPFKWVPIFLLTHICDLCEKCIFDRVSAADRTGGKNRSSRKVRTQIPFLSKGKLIYFLFMKYEKYPLLLSGCCITFSNIWEKEEKKEKVLFWKAVHCLCNLRCWFLSWLQYVIHSEEEERKKAAPMEEISPPWSY